MYVLAGRGSFHKKQHPGGGFVLVLPHTPLTVRDKQHNRVNLGVKYFQAFNSRTPSSHTGCVCALVRNLLVAGVPRIHDARRFGNSQHMVHPHHHAASDESR